MPHQIESEIISVTVGSRWQVPVDLNGIACRLGAEIQFASCQGGFTHFQPNGPVIYLSNMATHAKMRFILAHELAHILLRYPEAIRLIQELGQADLLENEEDLANRIAGVLLVPDMWIEEMKERAFTPIGLLEMARQAGIPIPMLIARAERAGIDIALLHWRRGKSSWHVVDRPGTPAFLHGPITISGRGNTAMDRLGRGELEIAVDCRVNGTWTRLEGRGFRWGDHGEDIFQFLVPSRNRQRPAVIRHSAPGAPDRGFLSG